MATSLQYITNESGERTAVLLPLAEYERMLEDLEDLATLAERRSGPSIPHDQFLKELRDDGILPA